MSHVSPSGNQRERTLLKSAQGVLLERRLGQEGRTTTGGRGLIGTFFLLTTPVAYVPVIF